MKSYFTKKNILLVLGSISLLSLIGFVEKDSSEKEIKSVIINIREEYGSHFIDEGDVQRLLTENHTDSVRGKLYSEINLKKLEQRVKCNKFAKDVQIYKDHKGNVLVDVVQRRPIARVVQVAGPHAYLDENGKVLPVSDKFTPRVVLIGGEGAGKLVDSVFLVSEEGKAFISFLNTIDADPFLRAQVSEISRERNGNLKLYPQVGDEVIEFGKPEDVEKKFNKMKIYYKKILPVKGYNKFKSVNLKFQDQIICE